MTFSRISRSTTRLSRRTRSCLRSRSAALRLDSYLSSTHPIPNWTTRASWIRTSSSCPLKCSSGCRRKRDSSVKSRRRKRSLLTSSRSLPSKLRMMMASCMPSLVSLAIPSALIRLTLQWTTSWTASSNSSNSKSTRWEGSTWLVKAFTRVRRKPPMKRSLWKALNRRKKTTLTRCRLSRYLTTLQMWLAVSHQSQSTHTTSRTSQLRRRWTPTSR